MSTYNEKVIAELQRDLASAREELNAARLEAKDLRRLLQRCLDAIDRGDTFFGDLFLEPIRKALES